MCLLWSAAVAQSCLILWDPKDCSPPGSSVHSILQARILVWVAMPSSRASSPPRHQMQVSYDPVLVGGFFTSSATWEALLSSTSIFLFFNQICRGTFSFKGSNMLLFSFVCCFSRTLYSLSVSGKQEWAELHTVLRTEIMREGTFLDSFQWLPSVTLLKCNLFSYAPLTQDMECFLALWILLFAWLCFCSTFLLPKAALYEDI